MSSINFTGLKSIKIGSGSTEATVYFRGTKLWPSVISPTFAVVDDIEAYTDTTYVDVYDKKTSSWYKLNDLKVYEKYGIYEKVTTLDRAVFVEKGCEVDLNNQWRESTYWSQTDYTCYESNSNYNVSNGYSSMKVIIPKGISSVTVYFGSYAESTCDYSVLWELDKNAPTSNPNDTTSGVVSSSKGKQNSKIAYTYTISDTSKSHFFWITYRKDGSADTGTDRGYLLIKQNIITGTTVYPDKLVIYNNDEYRWDGNQWLELGSITNAYPFKYPEKDTPPILISFNSVEERDAYTGVYNGLLCHVGDDYYVYNNGWKESKPALKVNNTIYPTGKWLMSDTNSGSTIKTLTVTVESSVECIVYAECNYSSSGTASITVDGTTAASWKVESQTSGSCTLTPGTHTVTFKGAMYTGAGYREYWSYLNPSKCYIQIKA
jgi:hypothetical protein